MGQHLLTVLKVCSLIQVLEKHGKKFYARLKQYQIYLQLSHVKVLQPLTVDDFFQTIVYSENLEKVVSKLGDLSELKPMLSCTPVEQTYDD